MPSIQAFCDAMRWAADSDRVGYSQSDRESLQEDGFFSWDYFNTDCSKLVVEALQYAGFDTGWASYTGNMSDALCANGWVRLPIETEAEPGDILLNDVNHVAVWLGDCLAQASIDENGNIAGGERGDQTGWEVNTRGYYDYPWDCILRYAGEPEPKPIAKRGVVQMHTLNGDKAQMWKLVKAGEYYKLQNKRTGWMLDVADANTAPGTLIQAWVMNGDDAQLFKLVNVEGTKAPLYEIVPKIAPDLRLDIRDAQLTDGGVVQLHYPNGNKAQRWSLIQNGKGVVNVVSALKTHLAMEIKDGW